MNGLVFSDFFHPPGKDTGWQSFEGFYFWLDSFSTPLMGIVHQVVVVIKLKNVAPVGLHVFADNHQDIINNRIDLLNGDVDEFVGNVGDEMLEFQLFFELFFRFFFCRRVNNVPFIVSDISFFVPVDNGMVIYPNCFSVGFHQTVFLFKGRMTLLAVECNFINDKTPILIMNDVVIGNISFYQF